MIKLICLFASLFITESLYAHKIEAKAGARLFTSPSSKSETLKELKAGESFEVTERRGMFWLVSLDGESAYLKVSESKRAEAKASEGGLQEALYEAALSHRQSGGESSMRSRSAAMGVRGLSSSSVNIDDIGSLRPNLNAVYLLEDRELSLERVQMLEELVTAEIEGVTAAKEAP